MNDKKKLKIAIGTDAFPPTTDGISNVAQRYAQSIKIWVKRLLLHLKTQISLTTDTIIKFTDIKVGGFRQKRVTA